MFGTLDWSGTSVAFIPCCTAPSQTSTGNVINPVELTYDQFKVDCYLNTSLKKYESMLVRITTPIIANDDYDGSTTDQDVWVYDNLDLLTKNAKGSNDYFIQKVFNNTDYIGKNIPMIPTIYQGIRTNVNWGALYGLITPRKESDYFAAVEAGIMANPGAVNFVNVLTGQCQSIYVYLYNEGVDNVDITGVSLENSSPGNKFSLVTPPAVPFTLGSWLSQSIRIDFCPSDLGPQSDNLIVAYGAGKSLVIPVTGTTILINSTPFCEDFNANEWLNNPTNNGWSTNGAAGGGNTIGIVDTRYFGNNTRIGSYGNSLIIYPFNNQTVYSTTPGFTISDNSKYLSFYQGKYDFFINGVAGTTAPSSDPRKVFISTDGQVTWTQIYSTPMSSIPEVYSPTLGTSFQKVEISLAAYQGKTVFFKFQANRVGSNRGYWFIDDFCVKGLITGPVISYDGTGDFGTSMFPVERSVNVSNIGLSLLRIKSVAIIGDPEFAIRPTYTYPIDVKGTPSAWSEYPVMDKLPFVIKFSPVATKSSTATLRITYGMAGDETLDIPLSGSGGATSCADGGIAVVGRNWAPSQNSWFKYTADRYQTVQITSCDPENTVVPYVYSFDTYLYVFSDCEGTLLASNDDSESACSYNRASSSVQIVMNAGETVYIAWPLMFPGTLHSEDGFYFHINPTYPIDGDVCETAIPLSLPVINLVGTTVGFNDDYNQSPCSPVSNYMDGNDVVYTLDLMYPGTLSGSIAGAYASVHILSDCPKQTLDVSACIGFAGGPNGGSFSSTVQSGKYYVIISSWAPPQTVDYTLNLQFAEQSNHVPDWTVDPEAYDYDGEITSEIFIDNVAVVRGQGILGAFAGDQCRGVKRGGLTGPSGKYVFIMRCYSNLASGETLSFRYYDPVNDTVFGIRETIPFEPNMMVGSALSPTALNAYHTVVASREFLKGWSWFSVNVESPDNSIGSVLGSLTPTEGDYIKNQTVSASWYNGIGWFGELSVIDPREMYKIKLASAGTLRLEGYEIDPAKVPISIKTGWNWIGFIPRAAQTVGTALSSINPAGSDYIKNQTTSSTFYTDYSWFGELSHLQALDGYMLRSSHPATLIYPSGVPLNAKNVKNEKSVKNVKNEKNEKSVKNVKSEKNVKSVKNVKSGGLGGNNPVTGHLSLVTDYEYSGQVNATIILNGENFSSEDYCLYSVVDGTVRGVSRGMWFEPIGKWIHNHLTYSTFSEGDTVRFRLHDTRTDTWYQFDEFVVFKADMIVASALDPFLLKTSSLLDPFTLKLEPSLEVYPNPASYLTTVQYTILSDQNVVIQVVDYTGRVVDELDLGQRQSGTHQESWNTGNPEQGVYYLKMKNTKIGYKQVVITR